MCSMLGLPFFYAVIVQFTDPNDRFRSENRHQLSRSTSRFVENCHINSFVPSSDHSFPTSFRQISIWVQPTSLRTDEIQHELFLTFGISFTSNSDHWRRRFTSSDSSQRWIRIGNSTRPIDFQFDSSTRAFLVWGHRFNIRSIAFLLCL